MNNKKEYLKLIATRVPPGDKWTLSEDSKNTIYKSLTDTLEAYFMATNYKGDYRLSPLNSKLYIIEEKVVEPEPEKGYNIYGDPI